VEFFYDEVIIVMSAVKRTQFVCLLLSPQVIYH